MGYAKKFKGKLFAEALSNSTNKLVNEDVNVRTELRAECYTKDQIDKALQGAKVEMRKQILTEVEKKYIEVGKSLQQLGSKRGWRVMQHPIHLYDQYPQID